ncbi:MAG: hypothetical protein AAEJ43_06280, partial [Gammaproteobacteria bacterium]
VEPVGSGVEAVFAPDFAAVELRDRPEQLPGGGGDVGGQGGDRVVEGSLGMELGRGLRGARVKVLEAAELSVLN